MLRTLVCVDPISQGFMRSHADFPCSVRVDLLGSAEEVFNRLWHEPEDIATVVIDSCWFDLEELFYASLNHTHVKFVVRSQGQLDDEWRRRLGKQSNVRLPGTDFMVWTHAFQDAPVSF